MTDPIHERRPQRRQTLHRHRRPAQGAQLRCCARAASPRRQRAFDRLWPRFGIDHAGAPRDFDALFGRKASASSKSASATARRCGIRRNAIRDRDHIGIEVHAPGVGRLLNARWPRTATMCASTTTMRWKCWNADRRRVARRDPHLLPRSLAQETPPQAATGEPEFAALLVRKLAPGGRLHLATDWQDYAERMWDVLDATRGLATAPARAATCRARLAPADPFRVARPAPRPWRPWDLLYDKSEEWGLGT